MPPRHATLKDLQEKDHSSSDEAQQSFYTGGKHSGMMVEGGKKKEHELANKILQQAEQSQGYEQEKDIEEGKGKDNAFTGSGNVIKGEKESKGQKKEPKKRLITFWEDGFTIDYCEDNGNEPLELRPYEDPNNRALLEAIQQGKAPLKELKVSRDEPVNVQVIHKMHEKYNKKRSDEAPKAFAGTARTLSENTTSTAKSNTQKQEGQIEQPVIDTTQPTVNHQLRFSDGRRVNATFNTNSSLKSMFEYARKVANAKKVKILTGHPPTEIHEQEGTLETCGLAKGSVLIIRPA